MPSWTSGCVSWPRCFSPPNENAQTGDEIADGVGVDSLQRGEALALRAEAVGHNVTRSGGVVDDVFDLDFGVDWQGEHRRDRERARSRIPIPEIHSGIPLGSVSRRLPLRSARKPRIGSFAAGTLAHATVMPYCQIVQSSACWLLSALFDTENLNAIDARRLFRAAMRKIKLRADDQLLRSTRGHETASSLG